jgi:Predicted Zn-dependent peptidases
MSAKSASAQFQLLAPFWKERVERTVLPNGLTVLIKPDASAPVASVQVWVKTGSIHEDAYLGAGLSHYLEHMLFKGTERREGREISQTVQAHGGYINAYTTFDRTVYYIDLPAEHVEVAVDLLADAVLHSTLPADEVAKEKDVILREIDMGRDEPDQRLWESLFETAFRQHPFRYPIIGYRDVFSAITRDDLTAYYRARYVPNNLVVVIVGAVDPAQTLAAVEKHFGGVPRKRLAPVTIPAETAQLAPRALHRFEDVEISRAAMAWQIPGIDHPDTPVLDVLATILGGGDSSVLWLELREKARLVHAIDAHSWTPGSAGLFTVSFHCEPERREAAERAVERVLARCAQKGFTTAQIRKAQQQAVVSEINSRKTMSGQASRLGAAEVVIGDLDYARVYFERVKKVSAAELRRVMKTYLVSSKLTSVSLNPTSAKKPSATSIGATGGEVNFEEIALPNGARLLLQSNKNLPNLHLRILCAGGPMHEPSDQRGATALLATLLTKDTRKRSAAQVAQTIEEVGGAFHPFSGNNSFGLALEVLPTDFPRALDLLQEALFAPAFKKTTFEIERDAQLADLRQDADDVVTYGRKLLRKKFFGAYPLAIDATGDEAGLKALTPAALAKLWKKYFVSRNVVLAVAGDFELRTLVPKLKALLARVPKGALPQTTASFERPAEIGDFIETQPREQAVVYQAFPGPGLKTTDYYVSEVADELFSGMSSRLFERVREEKALAYFVRSSRVVGLQNGMFFFYAGTSPQRYEEVLAELDAEIARVRAGEIEEAELHRCQTRLKAARKMGLQTNASRAMQAGLNALYGQPVNDWQNYDGYIDAVTIADLQRFARTYLRRELRTQLVVKA